MKKFSPQFVLFFLLTALSACDSTLEGLQSVQTGCTADAALITVGDGILQNLCGCQEAAGTTAVSGQSFQCTMSLGDTVIFQYLPTRLRHQILPVGTPAIIDGPVYDPDASIPIRSFGFKPTATGTYRFEDAFNTALTGQLVVQ